MGPVALEPCHRDLQTRQVGSATAGAQGACVLPASGLSSLVDALRADGFRVFAPRHDRGTLKIRELAGGEQLPRGLEDDQEPASYRATHYLHLEVDQ